MSPWPFGDGEMARRIRAQDWATTPLGPIERWPRSLRTALDLVLAMPGPATLLWGPAHVQLYNDAYVSIAQDRHPELLGRPVAEGWPDAYEAVILPLLEAARAGRSTRLTDHPVALRHPDGRIEERVFDTDWFPVRDEAGTVAGSLQTLVEVTGRRRAERALRDSEARHRLLVKSWAQAVWETDPEGVVVADSPSWRAYTGQTVEEWLGYGWLDAIHPDDRAFAERQWRAAMAARRAVDAEFRLRAPDGGWRWTNVRAAPLLDAGDRIEKWVGVNIDIDARKRAEEALIENERRYRALFESMDEAYAVVEVLKDEGGRWSDFRFLEVNSAFIEHTTMPWPVGKTATELLGTPNPHWIKIYGEALDTGKSVRIEEREATLGLIFDLNIFPLDRDRNRVAILFTNVTERKKAEAALRESEERQAFLLKLGDALRGETDERQVERVALDMLADQLSVDRAYITTSDYGKGETEVPVEVHRGELPPLVGIFRHADFPESAQQVNEGTLVVEDVETDTSLSELNRRSFAAVQIEALIGVGLRKGVSDIFWTLAVAMTEPRNWSPNEVLLMEEAAERIMAALARARAEAALRESEALRRVALSGGRMGTWHWDLDAGVCGGDARFMALWGFPPTDAPRPLTDYTDRMTPEGAAEMAEIVSRAVAAGEEFDGPLEIVAGPAAGRWVRWRGRAADVSGRVLDGITFDITEQKQAELALRESEERQAFLLRLSDALRPLGDPIEIMATASALTGPHLGLDRCFYGEVDAASEHAYIADNYCARGVPPFPQRVRLDDFSEEFVAIITTGATLAVDDIRNEPRLADPVQRGRYLAAQLQAFVGVPLVKGGRLVAILSAHQSSARQWTHNDIVLLEEVAERTWAAVERARAEAALRESEERNAFLLRFSDAVRGLSDPMRIAKESCRILTEQLRTERTLWAEIDWDTREYVADWSFLEDGTLVEPSRWPFDDTLPFAAEHLAGRSVAYDDVTVDPRIPDPVKAAMAERGLLAGIAAPVRVAGRLLAVLSTSQRVAPRRWRPEEVAFVEALAQRAWGEIERARAEAALRASEERFRLLADTVPQLVWMGEQAETIFYNRRWHAYTGLDEAESLGAVAWAEVVHPDDRALALERSDRSARTGEPYEIEYRLRRADGAFRWHIARAVRLDGTRTWIGAATDVDDLRRTRDALAESEERFRALTGAIEDVFYLTDLDRNALLYLSPAFEAIWARPAAALRADLGSFIETVHPEDRARVLEGKAAQERGEPVMIEYRIVRPDGGVRWLFDRSFPIGANGHGRRSAGIASDVTARKEIEESLRASEARFRQFAEAAPEVVWMRDAATLQWEYLSPAFETIYGLPRDEVLKADNLHRWADLILPEDREAALGAIERVRQGEQVTFEYRIRRPSDGKVRWLRNTDFPLRDAAGRIQRIGGFGQDITALKRADERLRESERRQRALIEGIPQLVWRAVDGGQWTWASPQWSAYTGLSNEASRGLGWLDALHPDDRDRAREAWHAAEGAAHLEVEYRLRHAGEGRHRWVTTRATPVRDEAGGIVEWLGTSTDIDDLRRLQDEQQVMVAELQHRTRNLIAVVRSIAQQTMTATASTEQFRARFNDRLAALSRVQGLLSRAADDRITIRALLQMEFDALGAGEVGDRIVLNGPEVALRNSVVQTLALALHELATNARKYGALATGNGRLRVTWRVRDGDGEGRRLALEWIEDGIDRRRDEESPTRKGYGRELIERALPYSLGAKTRFELSDAGVRCSIDLPLTRATRRGDQP